MDEVAEQVQGGKAFASKEEPVGKSPHALALHYLWQFVFDKTNWKFKNSRQKYVLKSLYCPNRISDAHFEWALVYISGLQGRARDDTGKAAEAIIRAVEDPEATFPKLEPIRLEDVPETDPNGNVALSVSHLPDPTLSATSPKFVRALAICKHI